MPQFFAVELVVVLGKEHRLAIVSTVDDVLWLVRKNDTE